MYVPLTSRQAQLGLSNWKVNILIEEYVIAIMSCLDATRWLSFCMHRSCVYSYKRKMASCIAVVAM